MRWTHFFIGLALTTSVSAAPYTPVWIDHSGHLSEATLAAALQGVEQQNADPRHIVVLIHGYDMEADKSLKAFDSIASHLQESYQKRGQSVAVVGLQWESEVKGPQFLPWIAAKGYFDMVPQARAVGRDGARQLLLRLQERYPNASLNVMAHSMGCELSNAMLSPQLTYQEDQPQNVPFEPGRSIRLNLLTLAGSDQDYDAAYKGEARYAFDPSQCKLVWLTISNDLNKSDQDRSLEDRDLVRGQAAGATFPRMRRTDYDLLFGSRQLYIEDKDIPPQHDMEAYYSPARVERLVASEIYLANPSAPKPVELDQLDQILSAANREQDLVPWLDSQELAPRMYALWRLEHLLCGGSQHLEDQSLIKVARLLKHYPHHVWGQRRNSPCQSIARGYWPTEQQMTRAGAPAWGKPRY